MAKKSRTKSQKKYKMVGCNKSKNSKKNRTKNKRKNSKKHLGGSLGGAALTPANYKAGKTIFLMMQKLIQLKDQNQVDSIF